MGQESARGSFDNDAAVALLAGTGFFGQCGPDDLGAVALCSRFVWHARDVDIVREGDVAAEVLIIQAGEVMVLKRGTESVEHEIARLKSGDSFGEMALLDPGTRSATVRAVTDVTLLVLPIRDLVRLAETRPSLVRALVGLARLVAGRLRSTNSTAVESLERALHEERTRTTMGKFVFLLIVAYSLYTWVLGTAIQAKEFLGHSEYVTLPVVAAIVAVVFRFMKTSGYSPAFFGLTLKDAPRHAAEALVLTVPMMAVAVLLKWWMVDHIASMRGAPIFALFAAGGTSALNPWLVLAYVLFVPLQELIYRGGLQGALEHFLTGPSRRWAAILGSNIIFSAGHLYISAGLSVSAFVAGLFWGWLYSRQRGLVGVSVSHILLGFWAFEVVDMGILE